MLDRLPSAERRSKWSKMWFGSCVVDVTPSQPKAIVNVR